MLNPKRQAGGAFDGEQEVRAAAGLSAHLPQGLRGGPTPPTMNKRLLSPYVVRRTNERRLSPPLFAANKRLLLPRLVRRTYTQLMLTALVRRSVRNIDGSCLYLMCAE